MISYWSKVEQYIIISNIVDVKPCSSIYYRSRLLRANLLQPLKDIETINARLDCLVSIGF